MSGQPGTAADPAPVTELVAVAVSRQVRAWHEQAFEQVLHRLAGAVCSQPGHLGITVLRPAPGGPPSYTIVSHFQTRADAEAWQASQQRALLTAGLTCMPPGSGKRGTCPAWRAGSPHPGAPVLVPPAWWKTALVPAAGIVLLLEVASCLLPARLAARPAPARPLVSVAIVILLLLYAVVPLLTRATRGFLYPACAPRPAAGAP